MLGYKVLGLDVGVLILIGVALILLPFLGVALRRWGRMFRGRRGVMIAIIGIVLVLLIIVKPAWPLRFITGFAGLFKGGTVILLLPLLWLIIAIPAIGRGTRRLRQVEDDGRARQGSTLIGRLLFGNPTLGAISITQIALWFIIINLSFATVALLVENWAVLSGSLLLMVLMLYKGHEVIPAETPHRGALTFLSKRTEVEMDEGLVLFFPFLESAFLVNIQKRERDIVVRDVRTQDDAPLDVKVSTAWTPDPDKLRQFLQVGDKNIIGLMESLVEQEVRIFFYNVPTWDLSEERIIDKRGNRERALREPYQVALGMREQLTDILINQMTTAENGREALKASLATGGAGLPDNQSWAIRFQNIYVGPIVLTGTLAAAAARRSTEAAERHGEVYEKETEALAAAELVKKYKAESGHDLDPAYALNLVMEYKAIMAGNGQVVSLSLSRVPKGVLEVLERILGKRGV